VAGVPDGAWWCVGCGGAAAAAGLSVSCVQESVLEPQLPFGGGELRWAQSGKYLGVTVAADCGLADELGGRIRLARAAFRRLRPLFHSGRMPRHARGTFARVFVALVGAVLLYGSEAWALSEAELGRLDVVMHGMLRQMLPPRLRRPGDDFKLISNRRLIAYFRVPTVGALLAQKQTRWLGHVARMDETRLPRLLLGARRTVAGARGRGCRGESLLGIYGKTGTLLQRAQAAETTSARAEFFGRTRGPWYVLAQRRSAWRRFARTVR